MRDDDDTNELDPAQFRVAGTDTKGHSARVWTNVQPMHLQTIDILIQSGKFPYRSRGDLIRHALVRHIHWLEDINKPIRSVTGAVDAILTVLRDAEFRSEFSETIERVVQRAQELLSEGDLHAAQKLVLETLRNVRSMPDGYWRNKYEKAILENPTCAKLISEAPRASMNIEQADQEELDVANG